MVCVSTGNNAISTGANPLNRLTLAASGSVAKNMSGVALTGLTNNLVVYGTSGLQGGANNNVSVLQTQVGLVPSAFVAVDDIEGTIIVPPGAVLALLCSSTPVAISAASDLSWEEVPQ